VLFTSPLGVAGVTVIAIITMGIVATLVREWRKVRVAEQAAALKQAMIQKGMSAADIERVLKAGGPSA
jgi:hypothetical protein